MRRSSTRISCSARPVASVTGRARLQDRLASLNPDLLEQGDLAPDGDADVPDALVASVRVPDCEACGGILKPDVVFFGDSVPRATVHVIEQALQGADGLLVVGSSLMVFSGYRFVRLAHGQGIPVACINPGRTRGDDLLDLKITAPCGPVLQELLADLKAPDRIPAPG